jgi:hypothetical protein
MNLSNLPTPAAKAKQIDAAKNIYSAAAVKPEKKTIKLKRKEFDLNTADSTPEVKIIQREK